tara:strand:- start:2071 stop:3435 length:1365 start_codon:yes stop_codon:yes gene_type:complete
MALEEIVEGGAAKSNSEGSRALFYKRLALKAHILRQNKALGVKNIIDFNTGEKLFYGRMNYESMSISLRRNANLKSIAASNNTVQPAMVLPFVADLFNEMVLVFKKALAQNQISSNTPYLSNLRAYRGFQSPREAHAKYKALFLSKIGKKIRSLNPTFSTLDEFVPVFMNHYGATLGTTPLTYSSFIKSRFNTILSSGLAIEVADLDYFNDDKKIAEFVESDNWSFFVQVCNNHGFMIDAHAPFRIVADLNSSIMLERAGFYGYAGVKGLFQREYKLAIILSIRDMISDLLEIYKHATSGTPVVETVMCGDQIVNRPIVTKSYTLREAYSAFTIEGLIMTYCFIKLAEVRPTMEDTKKQKLLRDIRDLYAAYRSLTVPLIYFEELISKTFDSIGSFSYYKKTAPAKLQALFDSGKIDAIEMETAVEQRSTGNFLGTSYMSTDGGGSSGTGGGGY